MVRTVATPPQANPLERAVARTRSQVQGVERVAERRIGDAYRAARGNLQPHLSALIGRYSDELRARQAQAAEGQRVAVPLAWLHAPQGGNLPHLAAATAMEMRAFGRAALGATTTAKQEAVTIGSTGAQEALRAAVKPIASVLPAGVFKQPSDAAVRAFVDRAKDGSPLHQLFDGFGPDEAQALRDTLSAGVAAGVNPRQLASEASDTLDRLSYGRAVTIMRTETLHAWNRAALENYRANADVVESWQWMAAKVNSCAACLAMDGTIHDLDEDLDGHPNCLVAGAVVAAAGVRASTTRWFAGEVVEVVTASGRHVTVTKNHPILTPEGWVAAGLLHEGGYVVGCGDAERVVRAADPDDYQVPSPIEDVAATLSKPGRIVARCMPVAPEDFHGDGRGSNICIVRTDGALWDAFYTALTEPALQDTLCPRHVALAFLASAGALQQGGDGLLAPAHSGLSLEDVDFADFGRTLRHAESVGLGNTARRDTILTQSKVNDAAGDSIASREGIDRFTGLIAADQIVHINHTTYVGHVYNLQTTRGWYIANNIITHNCRCAKAPVTRGYAAILADFGIDASDDDFSEPPWKTYQSGADWLAEQDEATQRAAFGGNAAYNVWKSGDADLSDYAQVRKDRQWGDSIQQASLKSMGLDASDYTSD